MCVCQVSCVPYFSVWMVITACLEMTSFSPPSFVHQQFTEICLLYITPLIFYFGFVDNDGGMEGSGGIKMIKEGRGSIKRII